MAKALLLALLMLPSVLQAEGRDIPYSKMNPLLSVEAQSPLIQIKLSVEVTDASLSFEDVNVWLAKDDEVITSIPVDLEDGRIQLLPMTEQQARRHALRINHPEEAVNINFELKVVVNELVPDRGLEAEFYNLAPVGNRRQLQKVAHLM